MKKVLAILLTVVVLVPSVYAVDVTIKNVPEGAEGNVKEMAMVAISRFIARQDLRIADAVKEKYETDIDTIRKANSLVAKYEELEEITTKEL